MTTYSVSSPTSTVEGRRTREFLVLGRRRRFLLPGTYQWRTLALVSGLSLALLAALDLALIQLVRSGSDQVLQVAPELRALVLGQDRDLVRLILVGSGLTFLGVLAVAVLETHRTAGPLLNVARTLERFGTDGPQVRLKLRKDDHFPEVEQAFNRMASEIEARSLKRVAELARITAQLRQAADSLTRPGGYDAHAQAHLRALAFDLQKLGEDVERR